MTFARNPNFMSAVRDEAGKRLVRAATAVRDNARARMDAGGGGEHYSGLDRPSSAPGESPVSQSGRLSESLTTYGPRPSGDDIEAAMGTNQFKILFLERGTASIAPRPLLYPSLVASRDEIMRIMAGHVEGRREDG